MCHSTRVATSLQRTWITINNFIKLLTIVMLCVIKTYQVGLIDDNNDIVQGTNDDSLLNE